MTLEQAHALVVEAIAEVAPDVDPAGLRGGDSLRVDLELDSIDFLSVVTRLGEEAGVDIPEADLRELTTVDACAEYLARVSALR